MKNIDILLNPLIEADNYSKQRGHWIVGVLETHIFWPKQRQIAYYEGKKFLLIPSENIEGTNNNSLPAIALMLDGNNITEKNARTEILRFASALAWQESFKIEIVMWSGGNLPRSISYMQGNSVSDYLDLQHLPTLLSESGKTAIAFYREGISLDNPFYSFLSLYKAFSVAIPDMKMRSAWVDSKRDFLRSQTAKERVAELEKAGNKIGTYLYEQCRHAIAHADREPFVNPDSSEDYYRLRNDLPVMRNFAEIAIEEELGVKSNSTIHREHFYELDGFRELFSSDYIEMMKAGTFGQKETIDINMPESFILIAKKGQVQYHLTDMQVKYGHLLPNGMLLEIISKTNLVGVIVVLNFESESLEFDPLNGFGINQPLTNDKLLKEEIAALKFQRCILSNGHLEIWNPENLKLLGQSSAYIPHNMLINYEWFDKEISDRESRLSL